MFLTIKMNDVRRTRTHVNIAAVPTEWMVALHNDLFEAEMDAAVRSEDGFTYIVVATPEAERFEAGEITAIARQGYLTLRW